jgi:Raf kinase inhibitor-like YbhB/YbcL family protein
VGRIMRCRYWTSGAGAAILVARHTHGSMMLVVPATTSRKLVRYKLHIGHALPRCSIRDHGHRVLTWRALGDETGCREEKHVTSTHMMNRRGLLARGAAGAGLLGLAGLSADQARAQATPTAPQATPQARGADCDPLALLPPTKAFTVTSADVRDGQQFPKAQLSGMFGAGGQDLSPQLSWSGFPEGTKSFCVTMYDPDAPTMSGFWHWVVADIPVSTAELPAGAGSADHSNLPAGALPLPNDARLTQYVGAAPAPGSGPHRYYIVVTAVDVATIGVKADVTPAFLMFNLGSHTLGRAVIVPIVEIAA